MMKIRTVFRSIVVCTLASALIVPASAENFYFDFSDDEFTESESVTFDREVRLCYAGGDAADFVYITRAFSVDTIEDLIHSMLAELTGANSYAEGTSMFRITSPASFELSCGTLTIDLPLGTFANLTEQEILFGCSALANSFLTLDEISAVNILHGGRSFTIYSLPIGVFTKSAENAMLQYGDFESRSSDYQNHETVPCRFLLYYPASDGSCYLPIVREAEISSDNAAFVLLHELSTAVSSEDMLIRQLPACENLLTEIPFIQITESGERIAEFRFDTLFSDYLALSGTESGLYYGSVALSVISNLPDINAVRFTIGSQPLDEIRLPDGSTIRLENGIISRSYLHSCIGSSSGMYLPDASGELSLRQVITGRHECVTTASLLRKFLNVCAADSSYEILPAGINGDDVLSVSIHGNTAVVDMSSNFYTACQSLNEDQERLLAYSMINTLCTKPGIRSVRFTIEGRNMDRFIHSICLSSELLPDPGLIK